MIRGARAVFCSVIAQQENLGDVVIRRNALSWSQQSQIRHHVLASGMADSYLSALDLDGDLCTVHRSGWSFAMAFIGHVAKGRVFVLFAPGPQITPSSRRELVKEVANLALVVAARVSGGATVSLGRSIRRGDSRLGFYLAQAVLRSIAYCTVRDEVSGPAVGMPLRFIPDIAFSDEKYRAGKRSELAMSFRYDQHVDPSMVERIVTWASLNSIEPVIVTQVRRDSARHRELATRFGIRHIDWVGESQREQLARVLDVYARCVATVTNRLHVAILGLSRGAAPIAVGESNSNKVRITLAPVVSVVTLGPPGCEVGALDSAVERRLKNCAEFTAAAGRVADSLREAHIRIGFQSASVPSGSERL